ncbi:McrC family protein [Aeromonas caviae]|uniref:McrC family protein n=1 Tax=Aeromonas caviae TaxID=648 RepID=A0AA42V8K2_AERCA|nr:McrC family protein [Aeromonas caviae]MDH1896533.1 McrC family protein [Aeromonas caviae]WGY75004.1 McrC family protein [Aeromonas caviae]
MTAPITVREYASLTTGPVPTPTLDRAHINPDDFDWLCQQSSRFQISHEELTAEGEDGSPPDGAPLVKVLGRRTLRLDNYVGVVETPSGQLIEILPKTANEGDSPEQGRLLLRQMLECALDLPPREASEAALLGFDAPLSEWVMARFLDALQYLVKRGIRSDYRRIEGEEHFLRGQLDVVRQMRQPPGRAHHFALRYDLYLPDRAENRLLKLALEQVAAATQSPESWRLTQELRHLLTEVPASRDVAGDFRQWRDDRLMAHYRDVRPWCELILHRIMPMALHGEWRGISLLFPMERLFERYVEVCLRRQLLPGAELRSQAASRSLCTHQGKPMFQLRPDLLLSHGKQRWVLDAKWKQLDGSDKQNKFGISQADLYQLFAYGHKYLGGQGDLVLIYPSWQRFKAPLAPFHFDHDGKLRLWVLPFELGEGMEHRLLLPVWSAGDEAPTLCLPLRPEPITSQSLQA